MGQMADTIRIHRTQLCRLYNHPDKYSPNFQTVKSIIALLEEEGVIGGVNITSEYE